MQRIHQFQEEHRFICDFVRENYLDLAISRNQLRCLWTAFCIRYGLVVDTGDYEYYLAQVFRSIPAENFELTGWRDYDAFGVFMCEYLV